jgi:hypothetical protein
MPHAIFCMLMAIVECGGFASIHQIMAASGYEKSYVSTFKAKLMQRGWMYMPNSRLFGITERGKIALAIEVGIRARAAANGHHRKRVIIKEYLTDKRMAKWWS